jgi:hypothetical protein
MQIQFSNRNTTSETTSPSQRQALEVLLLISRPLQSEGAGNAGLPVGQITWIRFNKSPRPRGEFLRVVAGLVPAIQR